MPDSRHPRDSSSTDLFEESLEHSRRDNTQLINSMRLVLISGFLVVYAHGILVLKLSNLTASLGLAIGYWVVALGMWFFGTRSRRAIHACRFAIPLFDLPMVTLIQAINLPLSESVGAVQAFTVSILLFLIVMGSFVMRPWQLYVCAGLAALCLEVLVYRVGERELSWVAPPVLLFVTAWMVSHLPRRQARLLRDAAEKQARRDRLALYFSPGVAEVIESHNEPGEGEDCELSVLFCDIRGFTGLSELLEPAEVVKLLNDFHGHMVDAVFRFGGTLDKYLGDGLLAYFNAPVRQNDHAERSVRCALAMLDALHEFNRQRAADGAQAIRVGIGVHAGTAIVGNIGASHRREFTAIGDTVNVASRLEELTKSHDTELLISETVVDGIHDCDDLKFEAIDSVEIRGRKKPVGLFAPSVEGTPEASHSPAAS